jgi:hypothetical protein
MVRPARIAVPAGLGATAAIHAAWALGWRWPGGTDAALAARVVGAGATLPRAPLIWAVAGVLGASATVVAMVGAGRSEPLLRAGTWGIAAVLVARGAVGIPVDLIGGLDSSSRDGTSRSTPRCAWPSASGPPSSPADRARARRAARRAPTSSATPCQRECTMLEVIQGQAVDLTMGRVFHLPDPPGDPRSRAHAAPRRSNDAGSMNTTPPPPGQAGA